MRLFTSLLLVLFTYPSLVAQMGEGQFLSESLMHNDLRRTYVIYVPPSYDGTEAWPLVINMHGAGSNIGQLIFQSEMQLVADTAHFLMVFPQATINTANNQAVWNALLNPNRVDDVGFIDRLINQVALEFAVDPARIYAAGFSNGGSMSYRLACQLSDRIAAIASVAGAIPDPVYQNTCNLERPVPILHMHGTADPVVPFAGGPGPQEGLNFPVIDEYVQFWVNQNNCTGDPTIVEVPDTNTTDNSTVQLQKYEHCNETAEVFYYTIDNGSHVWPGGPEVPPGFEFLGTTVNRDIHASVEIWNFFNRHVHPDPRGMSQLLEKTITINGIEREYLLYIPAAYDENEAWPLVLNLHGYLWDPQSHIEISDMNSVADTGQFLVAYPAGELIDISEAGLPSYIPLMGPGWNLGGDVSQNDDIAFMIQMIEEVTSEYAVDESRIYSTGYSMGGILSYMLACSAPDQIAAIAPVGASLLPFEGTISFPCNPGKPVPVLQIHGTNDIIDPYDGSPVSQGVEKSIAFWLKNNNCEPDSVFTTFPNLDLEDMSTVANIQYRNCEENSEVWFFRINGGNHWWAGGGEIPPGFSALGPANRDIHASSEIWNFFNRHRLATEPDAIQYLDVSEVDLQVFPNPFRQELNFSFSLTDAGRVQLDIFNALGRPVAQVTNKRLPAGEHRLHWQQQELSPGIYYYRLKIGNQEVSRRVVLFR